jgi:hypothetical protein
MPFLGIGNRGGGESHTTETITVKSTKRQILIFAAIYGIASLVQILILLATALLLGQVAGLAFLLLGIGLSFKPVAVAEVRPFTLAFGIRSRRRMPAHLRFAQAVLLLSGVVLAVLAITGYLPALWRWRLTWQDEGYIILSKILHWSWHEAASGEILARVLATATVPFVGWGMALMVKWAARMEIIKPSFREAPVGEASSDSVEGPMGEKFRPSRVGGRDPEPQEPEERPSYNAPLVEE